MRVTLVVRRGNATLWIPVDYRTVEELKEKIRRIKEELGIEDYSIE